jgi:hypothetical protein
MADDGLDVDAIRTQVATIRGVLAQLEIRVVGGSFLIIYEGSNPERTSQGTMPFEMHNK